MKNPKLRLQKIDAPFYFFSSHAEKLYTEVSYTENSLLIFGSESHGLPQIYHQSWPERFVTIPMTGKERCLNLSNAVAVGVYEGLRQLAFATF